MHNYTFGRLVSERLLHVDSLWDFCVGEGDAVFGSWNRNETYATATDAVFTFYDNGRRVSSVLARSALFPRAYVGRSNIDTARLAVVRHRDEVPNVGICLAANAQRDWGSRAIQNMLACGVPQNNVIVCTTAPPRDDCATTCRLVLAETHCWELSGLERFYARPEVFDGFTHLLFVDDTCHFTPLSWGLLNAAARIGVDMVEPSAPPNCNAVLFSTDALRRRPDWANSLQAQVCNYKHADDYAGGLPSTYMDRLRREAETRVNLQKPCTYGSRHAGVCGLRDVVYIPGWESYAVRSV